MTEEEAPNSRLDPSLHAWSILGIALSITILAFIVPPMFSRPRDVPRVVTCGRNIRMMVLDMQIWQQDHDKKFPDATTFWADMTFPPKTTRCFTYAKHKNGYGYHAALGGTTLKQLGIDPQRLPVVTDSASPSHLLFSTNDIDYRHDGKTNVGYADGHLDRNSPGEVTIRQVKP